MHNVLMQEIILPPDFQGSNAVYRSQLLKNNRELMRYMPEVAEEYDLHMT